MSTGSSSTSARSRYHAATLLRRGKSETRYSVESSSSSSSSGTTLSSPGSSNGSSAPPRRPRPLRPRPSTGRVRVDNRGEGRHDLTLAQPHHDHALRRAAEPLDVLDRHLDHGSAGRDQHDLIPVANDAGAGEPAARLGELNGLHAHPASPLARVLGDARALAVAVVRDDEQIGLVACDLGRDDLVVAA